MKVTGKPLRKIVKGLSRQERSKLNNELLRLQDPRLTLKLLKLKQANAVAATIGFSSSSMPGNIKTLAIGVYEEVSQ